MALTVIDRAIQSFGAEGLSQDTELAERWANLRTLRFADVRAEFRILAYHPVTDFNLLVFRDLMPCTSNRSDSGSSSVQLLWLSEPGS